MIDKDVLAVWKKVSGVVADEISGNADFAKKIADALGIGGDNNDTTTPPKRKNRRSPAKLDPFALLEQGEEKLLSALKDLTIDELKDVISANGMDTSKLALKWKDHSRLEKHIIDATKRKSARGQAFWNSQGGQSDSVFNNIP